MKVIGALPEIAERIAEAGVPNVGALRFTPARPIRREGRKAVIDIEGLITPTASFYNLLFGGSGLDMVRTAIDEAVSDKAIDEIELRVNSGGGFVEGVSETYNAIKAAAAIKPVNAAVEGTAASAAYWLASAADTIAVKDSSILGSIGVVSTYSREYAEDAINVVSKNAPNKRPDPRTEEGQAEIQKTLNAIEDLMIDQIAQGRGVSPEKARENYGKGGLFVGAQAVAAGLADSLTAYKNNKKESTSMANEDIRQEVTVAAEGHKAEVTPALSENVAAVTPVANERKDQGERLSALREVVAHCERQGHPLSGAQILALSTDEGLSAEAIRAAGIEHLAQFSQAPVSFTGGEKRNSRRELVQKALELRAGLCDGKVEDEVAKYARTPIIGLAAMAEGADPLAAISSCDPTMANQMLANSGGQFPTLLGTVIQKVINQELDAVGETTYQRIAQEKRMKTTTGKEAMLDGFTGYIPLADIHDLSANEIFVGEKTQEYELKARTVSFSLTPDMLINDQLNFFDNGAELVREYARMVKPTENKLVYDLLLGRAESAGYTLGDGLGLFDTSRGNSAVGSDSSAKTWFLADARLGRALKYLHLASQPAPRIEREYKLYQGLQFKTLHYVSAAYLSLPQFIYKVEETELTAASLEAAFSLFSLQKVNGAASNLTAATLIVPKSLELTAEKLLFGNYVPTFVDDTRVTSIGRLKVVADAQLDI
jgi:ClpP class serine protease